MVRTIWQYEAPRQIYMKSADGRDLVIASGYTIYNLGPSSAANIIYDHVDLVLLDPPFNYRWEPDPTIVPIVTLSAIADEDYTQLPMWAVDRAYGYRNSVGRAVIRADVALRGPHSKIVRLAFQATIIGKLMPTAAAAEEELRSKEREMIMAGDLSK